MYLNEVVADVQNAPDNRNLPVNRVGIKQLRHPLVFEGQSVVGYFDMFVNLAKHLKGTHMSRFIELLNEGPVALSIPTAGLWAKTIRERLQSNQSYLKIQFPFFIEKQAPVSKAKSLMDYDIILESECHGEQTQTTVTIIIPVTSLCPCSKEISAYGAHNQRSHLTVTVQVDSVFCLKSLIQLVEDQASCELYSLLKRSDEKAVTERAYENPKFVEDLVRDVAMKLEKMPAIRGYSITSENFESIHNHSAFAQISRLAQPVWQTAKSNVEALDKELAL